MASSSPGLRSKSVISIRVLRRKDSIVVIDSSGLGSVQVGRLGENLTVQILVKEDLSNVVDLSSVADDGTVGRYTVVRLDHGVYMHGPTSI